jgi:hypothetical protein
LGDARLQCELALAVANGELWKQAQRLDEWHAARAAALKRSDRRGAHPAETIIHLRDVLATVQRAAESIEQQNQPTSP